MTIVPFIVTPLTDFGNLLTPDFDYYSSDKFCTKLRIKYYDCLEAYGMAKGKDKCRALFYDVCECFSQEFQKARARAIREERMKQYKEGKLEKPFDQNPPPESYMYF